MNGKYDSRLSPMTRLIYGDLLLRCNYGARPTCVTDKELAERFALTERSVSRIVNVLCREGYLVKKNAHRKRTLNIADLRRAAPELTEKPRRSAGKSANATHKVRK